MTSEEIISYLNHKATLENPSPNRFKKEAKDFLIEFAKNISLETTDLKIIFYMWSHNINEVPVCSYINCNAPSRFINFNFGFSKGCSQDHATKSVMLEKYGVEKPFQSETIQKKVTSTFIEKYGNAIPVKTEHYKAVMLRKFGVDMPFKSQQVVKLAHDAIRKKYGGIGNGSQEILNRVSDTQKRHYFEKLLSDNYPAIPLFTINEFFGVKGYTTKYKWKCKACAEIFKHTITDGLLPRCPKCYPPQTSGISIGERELRSVVSENAIFNDKTILSGKELDIFIPEKKLAIEFNGLYWHSELQGKDKNYHLNKTIKCEESGIQLIHVFEDEWIYKNEIVKSIINAKLGNFIERIYARQCSVREISTKEKNIFLEENHIQGFDTSSVKIGLFYKNELVSIMTFGKPRFNKKYQYELHRFASKQGYQIIGGASRMFKYFIRKYNPESIISYADRRYSDGTFYEKIGFLKKGSSSPSFWVIGPKIIGKESRFQWQKHKLKCKLNNYSKDLTVWENLQIHGYNRIWDCGHWIFVWYSSFPK